MGLTDVVVESSASQHVGSGSELLLNDIQLSDSGMYMCTASNTNSSTTALVTVRVTGLLHTATLSLAYDYKQDN